MEQRSKVETYHLCKHIPNIKVSHIAEKYGVSLLFLPPYNAQFNPIEHCWYLLKHYIFSVRGSPRYTTEAMKTLIREGYEKLENQMAHKVKNAYQHCIKVIANIDTVTLINI